MKEEEFYKIICKRIGNSIDAEDLVPDRIYVFDTKCGDIWIFRFKDLNEFRHILNDFAISNPIKDRPFEIYVDDNPSGYFSDREIYYEATPEQIKLYESLEKGELSRILE